MLRFFYTILWHLLIPFVVLRLFWKGRRLNAYRRRIRERFACCRIEPADVWLHAVSLGEVVAATPLIEALLEQRVRVFVTTMTPTGSQQVITRFGHRVMHQYLPYDLPWALRRFFKKLQARVGIIMETELWPNVMHEAMRARLPLVLVNARISDRAFQSYKQLAFFFKPFLRDFYAILAQSPLDAERFCALGARYDRVHALGNIKFDVNIEGLDVAFFNALKQQWGEARPVLIAASTHDDEEAQLLQALPRLQAQMSKVLLLIAPRHPERFKAVHDLAHQCGFQAALRSQPESISEQTDVVVLDSLGELLGWYQVSDYAFVGGSFVPVGGHNVLEPIAMKTPVFCGPFMMNSKAIVAALLDAKAIQCVTDADELWRQLLVMHRDTATRLHQIQQASRVLKENQGVILKSLAIIQTAWH